MRFPARTLAITIALVLAAPAATAGWKTFGSFEPDTPQDLSGGYMHVNPDVSTNPDHHQTYFNVIVAYEEVSFNQNFGALESRLMIEGFQWPYAILGIWKDCNADGYIGYGAGALIEYHATLLTLPDTPNVCPAGSSAHNDGEWVYEFIAVGPEDNVPAPGGELPRMINDTAAYVWGDIGLPGSPHGAGCFINPPTGTFASSGGVIAWADCFTGYQGHTAVSLVDPDGSQNLKWDKPNEAHCDDSTLTSIPIGLWSDVPQCPDNNPGKLEENTGRPAFSAFDCSSDPALAVDDETGLIPDSVPDPTEGELAIVFGDDGIELKNEDGSVRRVYAPAVPSTDEGGSYYDGANGTYWAAVDNCEEPNGGFYTSAEWEVSNEQSVKREPDYTFEFTADEVHALVPPSIQDGIGDDFPRYGGISPLRTGSYFLTNMPVWRPGTLVTNSVIINSDTLEPQGAAYYTFYARVSDPMAVSGSPASTTGTYGSEWCTKSDDPAANGGFDCDADNWWDPAKGASPMPTEFYTNRPLGQAPGAAYHLRDIDCYDGTVVDPVRVGLGDISEEGICPAVV